MLTHKLIMNIILNFKLLFYCEGRVFDAMVIIDRSLKQNNVICNMLIYFIIRSAAIKYTFEMKNLFIILFRDFFLFHKVLHK